MSSTEKEGPSGMTDLVNGFERAGITRIFGTATVATTTLLDAVRRSPIEVVLSTNDSCALYMAEAESRVTGRLGVCVLTGRPGMAAFAGLIEAAVSDSPVMVVLASTAIASQPMASDRQQMAAIDSLCRAVFRVGVGDEAPIVLARALCTAYEGDLGPVLVEIPALVQRTTVNLQDVNFLPSEQRLSASAEVKLKQVVELIESADSVGFLVGPGCCSVEEQIVNLAEKLEAPVAGVDSGLGVLPFAHALSVGPVVGPVTSLAEKALASCELVLVIGCTMAASIGEFARKLRGRLVHIYGSSNQPTVDVRAGMMVQAQVKAAMTFISEQLTQRERPGGANLRELIRHEKRRQRQEILNRPPWSVAVDPVKFFVTLRELLAGEDVLILDNGPHAAFGIGYYTVQAPRSLLMPLDRETLGFSVPAAVAVSLALPDRRVVACVEERGFWLTGMELLTARRCNSAPLVVVFCADQMNLESLPDDSPLSRSACAQLMPVDYEALARGYGVRHVCIRADCELAEGLRRALTGGAPVLVELRVSYSSC